MSQDISHPCALQVAQQAIAYLLQWADKDLPKPDIESEAQAVTEAKKLLIWGDASEIKSLHLLFDRVRLPNSTGQDEQHYHPMMAIANTDPLIPYPLKHEPSHAEQNAALHNGGMN